MVRKKIGSADVEVLRAIIQLPDGREFSDLSVTIWDTKVSPAEKVIPTWAGFFDAPNDVAGAIVLRADTCEILFADGRTGTIRVQQVKLDDTSSKVNFWGVGPLR